MKRKIRFILIIIITVILLTVVGMELFVEDTMIKKSGEVIDPVIKSEKEYKVVVKKTGLLKITLTSESYFFDLKRETGMIKANYSPSKNNKSIILETLKGLMLKGRQSQALKINDMNEITISLEEGTYYLRTNSENTNNYIKYKFFLKKVDGEKDREGTAKGYKMRVTRKYSGVNSYKILDKSTFMMFLHKYKEQVGNDDIDFSEG